MTTQRDRARAFHALHRGGRILILPNAWDAASARIFELTGAPAVATTSSGLAGSLGYPDGERIPCELVIGAVRRIIATVAIPVSVDFERGYADGPAQVDQFRGDTAGADQAERLAAQVDVVLRGPPPRLQLVRLEPGPLGHRQHQAQGVFGDDRRRPAGQVADHDAQFPGCLQVDGVRADAAGGDHFQARQPAEYVARPPDRPRGC